ncbi:MAG: hypothetical protein NC324_07905 [Bacteroides sp.]|nr:hypothetical protein [Bacteroides sp.]
MKGKIFLRNLLTLPGLLMCMPLWAQWQDSFEKDLDAWQGTKEYFRLDSGRLHSCGPEKKSVLYLSRAFHAEENEVDIPFVRGVIKGDSALAFEFGLDLQFVPSTTNSLRLYLFSRTPVLDDTAEALYLHLGQKGGENRWQLFYNSPDTNYMLWQGETVFSKQKQMKFGLRAVYHPNAYMRFYVDDGSSGKPVWKPEGDSLRMDILRPVFLPDTASEEAPLFYSGLMAAYQTASRADKYLFDHALAGRLPVEEQEGNTGIVHRPFDTVWEAEVADRLCLCHIPQAGSLAVNEILFNPRSGESRFVEVRNLSDTVFCLYDLALGVSNGNGWKYSRVFKDYLLMLKPNAHIAFAKDALGISPLYRAEPANIYTAVAFPSLSDKAGNLRLMWLPKAGDSLQDTVVIDEVFYSEEFHHWLLPDAEGVSLERIDAFEPAMSAGNWASAAETAGYATPGCENSHQRHAGTEEDAKYFSLNPPLVTPDNDGRNDFTSIRWNERLSGFVCSMTVYDEHGRKIKTLCQQTLLGAGGEIRYDATDAQGRILRPGIYVLYIDLIRPDRRHKRLRYALAVG